MYTPDEYVVSDCILVFFSCIVWCIYANFIMSFFLIHPIRGSKLLLTSMNNTVHVTVVILMKLHCMHRFLFSWSEYDKLISCDTSVWRILCVKYHPTNEGLYRVSCEGR